ncbi:MAG: hypothetical protein IJL87_08545, partial [Clostridia bacterium]|nr:hypothetical protein [Clostridia bacterium]
EICDGAFNTDFRMRSINLPCSLTSIDNGAFNYCRSLTAYGYYGSYAYQFAEETGLSFVCLPAELVDSNTNVSVSGQKLQGDATLVVSSANSHISKYIKREKVLEAYDVYLEKDGQNVQPGDTVTVKLPAPEGAEASACRVYSIDTVGRYIDMNAEYEDGYLTFTADRLNTYFAITTGQPIDAFVFKVDDYNAYWATYDQLFEVDVPCQFVGGSTYVPFRVIAQAAGAESVSYDPNAATVTLVNSLGMTVVLKIDSTDCTVTYGGQTFETTVNAAPTFIDGAVCLPVRDVANVTFSTVEYMNYFGEGYVFVSPNKLSQDDIEEVIWCYISKIIN